MPELLYLSSAKLRRWPAASAGARELGRRMGGEIGGGILPATLSVAPRTHVEGAGAALQHDYNILRRVLKDIESSDRFPRWIMTSSQGLDNGFSSTA